MKKTAPFACIFAGCLMAGLAACGGSSHQTAPTTSPPSVPTPTTSSPAQSSIPGQQAAKIGQAFSINTSKTTLSITVDSLKCGGLDAKIMAAYYNSIGEQPKIPTPQSGHQWCVLQVHAKNIGHVNDSWQPTEAILNVGPDSYNAEAGGDASTIVQAYEDTSNGHGPEYGLNPNERGPDWAAYEIPTGASPNAVTVPSGDQGSVIVDLGH
jgi:hypothetical protein